ncbi:ATP-dependent DNA helicase RecG [Brevibacterium album]|uniref:ATP-dependent DNA helicase RecG n=1 Tax=Brevibacterium album TaxID=417948 RepID=UPI000427EEC7|nr:ATP-dependent DNA helicase RecG [Brevibacterium album]
MSEPDALFGSIVGRTQDRKLLESAGVTGTEELLRRFPRRWVDPGRFTEIRTLSEYEEGTDVIIHASVLSVGTRRMQSRKGSITTVVLADEHGGTVEAVFFNRAWMGSRLEQGTRVLVSAKTKSYRGRLQLTSPVLLTGDGQIATDPADSAEDLAELAPTRPIPVYPASGKLTSQRFRTFAGRALDLAPAELFEDPIPADLRAAHGLMGFRDALEAMHRPRTMGQAHAASRRWAYEEALALQVHLLQRRQEHEAVHALALAGGIRTSLEAFDARLPFPLTPSQREEGARIGEELAGARPMNRLLQGDVGSGKTLVAMRAMLQAADSGAQSVMLAPTEVLAAQHHRSLTAMLGEQAVPVRGRRSLFYGEGPGEDAAEDAEVAVALLTGSMPKKARQQVLSDLLLGSIDIVVGTHALLSDTTMFHELGLVIVDEQHRFGVEQRAALRQKAGDRTPHTLVMTATPIPRSAALTVFGDLDFSTLTDLPAGPKRIATHVVPLSAHPTWIERVCEVLAERVGQGQQVFAVLPRIEASTDDSGRTLPGVEECADWLRSRPELGGARIEVLHGQQPTADKEAAMAAFAAGSTDILISTTVVEVGIDVPNARVMVIVDADRFGIAQLHQLRGRVGRSGEESLCFLLTHAEPDSEAMARLQTVADTLDGFALADFDIRSRREGDVLGRQQWGGRSSLQHLSVLRHEELIRTARSDAQGLLARDPALREVPGLARRIAELFRDTDEEIFEAG